MDKKFTNREFEAIVSEIIRIARTINKRTTNNCSIHFDNDDVTLYINGSEEEEYKCKVMINFHKGRYLPVKEFGCFSQFLSTIPNISYGKYLNNISQSYLTCDKEKYYFEF